MLQEKTFSVILIRFIVKNTICISRYLHLYTDYQHPSNNNYKKSNLRTKLCDNKRLSMFLLCIVIQIYGIYSDITIIFYFHYH